MYFAYWYVPITMITLVCIGMEYTCVQAINVTGSLYVFCTFSEIDFILKVKTLEFYLFWFF